MLLDRDGVLNRQVLSGYVTTPDEWEWLPAAREACAALAAARYPVAIVTNQSAVGRGFLASSVLAAIHQRMYEDLAGLGVPKWPVFICPHTPEDTCSCRKPEPGLLLEALHGFGVSPCDAVFIGDHSTDLAAADRAGCRSVHVRSGREQDPALPASCIGSVADLASAVASINVQENYEE